MLRSFRVENHKSIRDELELVFAPQYDKSRLVVPVTAIFGANASGKSNLLDALRWLQDAVRHSYASWEPGAGVPRAPFALDPDAAAKPSGYAVDVVIDGLRHSYGAIVDGQRVREEWLHTFPHGRRRSVFERTAAGIKLGSAVGDRRGLGKLLERQTRPNALFLGVAAQNDLPDVQAIYEWFRSGILFGSRDAVAQADLVRLLEDDEERDAVVSLILAADLGLSDVTTVDFEAAPTMDISDVPLGMVTGYLAGQPAQALVFRHGKHRAPLSLADQSAGTRSWIALVTQALTAIRRGGLLVVDEIDASLHPHLSAQLARLFREPEVNTLGAQLLFSTHDATLLDGDTLARDEVWFVDKDADTGVTDLYALSEFHPRKNEDTEGRYLAGAYGAVPVLSISALANAVRDRRERDAQA